MKKITYLLFAIMVLSLSGCSIFQGGNKAFEGYIKYTVNIESDIDEATRSQLPTSTTDYYKETKIRKEQNTAMFSITAITDNATKETIMLMDLMGQKIALKQTAEDIDKAKGEMPESEFNETGESKEILGYNCKKVEVTMGEDVYSAFYTTDIATNGNHNASGLFNKIDGVILEYTIAQQGIVMHYIANEVKKQHVGEDMFTIPEDYELKTTEELQSLFGM
jgi:GLPGLI family protein